MSKTVVPMFFSRRGNKTKNKQIVNSSVTKEARIYNGEELSLNKWCWEDSTTTYKRMKLEHSLTPYTKLNVRSDSNGVFLMSHDSHRQYQTSRV